MQHVQKQYGVTNNLTELEIPWTRGKRSADGTMCVMIQPDERTTGTIILHVLFHVSYSIIKLTCMRHDTKWLDKLKGHGHDFGQNYFLFLLFAML